MKTKDDIIKVCPLCKLKISVDDILNNSQVIPIGINLDPEDPEFNFYFFTHIDSNCNTTFTVNVEIFKSCIEDHIPENINTGKEGCNGHCSDLSDNLICRATCKWAPYRTFIINLINIKVKEPLKS